MAGFLAQLTNHPECPIWFQQKCYALSEYAAVLAQQKVWWREGELFRIELWQTWKSRAYDPWGIAERSLLGVYGHSNVQQWIRECGWVHLLQLSGIHWIYLRRTWFFTIQFFVREKVIIGIWIFRGLFWISVTFFWFLCGWKWGMMRPILQLSWSEWSFRSRWRLRAGYSILGVAAIEGVSEIFARFGLGVEEWSYWGRLHYFLAVAGTSIGFRYFQSGAMASLFSWLFVLPLSWVDAAPVSLLTPFLNWISSLWIGVLWIPLVLVDLWMRVFCKWSGLSFEIFFFWIQRMEDYLFSMTGFGVTRISVLMTKGGFVREWSQPLVAAVGMVVIFFVYWNRWITKVIGRRRSPLYDR